MNAFINTISYYLPQRVVTNECISEMHPEWSVDKISLKVGIEQRHWSDATETASDLAFNAAENLLKQNEIDRNDIDFVIFCTQSPDFFLPTSACILQHRLGLPSVCGAFDYNLGCSGYIYGLGLAKGLIYTNQASTVLLLTGETYSKYINQKDKGNKTMFGDAGTATLVSSRKMDLGLDAEIKDFCYGTDGSQADCLIVKNGMARHKEIDGKDEFDEEGSFIKNDNNLYMDGKAIFNFTAFKIPPLIKSTLVNNNLSIDEVDEFIFHQANEFMLKTVRKRCGIPEDKFYIDIKELGNTVSNTIPIALCKALKNGYLTGKSNIMLAGFGVGLSMGAVVIKK